MKTGRRKTDVEKEQNEFLRKLAFVEGLSGKEIADRYNKKYGTNYNCAAQRQKLWNRAYKTAEQLNLTHPMPEEKKNETSIQNNI